MERGSLAAEFPTCRSRPSQLEWDFSDNPARIAPSHMAAKTPHPTSLRNLPLRASYRMAIGAGGIWTWAVALLATRHHLVGTYSVIPGAPWFWGPVVLPVALAALILLLGVLLTLLCLHYARTCRERVPRAIAWLLASSFVPALDLLRLLDVPLPPTFLEPLVLTAITAVALGEMAASQPVPSRVQRLAAAAWGWVVWIVALALGIWWYRQSVQAYDSFLLGFNDFGHFGQRVANTWAGRGFLMETPSLPPFWDHFNPGLALLAPLWGLWPDPRLFMLIQAVCLLLPAPILYGTARQLGATRIEAAMWGVAYLAYPALSQLNLSFSYGWHPVSLAFPLLFLAVFLLLKGQRIGALMTALLACSFQEDVVVILGCLAAAMTLQCVWERWQNRRRGLPPSEAGILASRLPLWTWATINLVSIAAFVLIYQYSGLRPYQVSRFQQLGDSGVEILASPILRPHIFWGTVLRPESLYFVAALSVPLGWRALYRGRWILLACALPVGVLLAWGHLPAISIAFQYTTTLIPVLFLAAIAGGTHQAGDQASCGAAVGPMGRASVTALAGCLAASLWLGSSPWCRNTLTEVLAQTYAAVEMSRLEDRIAGSSGIEALHQILALVDKEDATVLATGRIAAHFLGVERLDTVGQAPQRWAAFQREAGPGRSGIELFDWVLIDTYEHFQQSEENIEFVLNEARLANYRTVEARHGIVVLRRPDEKRSSP